MRIRKSTALTAILGVALIAIILVGTTLAYLTDSTISTNVTYAFNANDVTITLEEPIWDLNKEEQEIFKGEAALMTPGQKIIKDPQVRVAQESAPCYIRLKVRIDDELANVIRTPIRTGDGWTVTEHPREANTYYYYYPKVLNAGEVTTRAFDYVEIISQAEIDKLEALLLESLHAGNNMYIWVSAQVIQAYGFTYPQAMSVLDAAEEDGSLIIVG